MRLLPLVKRSRGLWVLNRRLAKYVAMRVPKESESSSAFAPHAAGQFAPTPVGSLAKKQIKIAN
jgi:hypothetical protein